MPHVVWDWNGTLLDDLEVVVASVNACLAELGTEPISADDYRATFVRPVHRFYERLLHRPVGGDEMQRLDTVFHEEYFSLVGSARPAADAAEAIALVRSGGRSQSIASMMRHEWLVPMVSDLGFASGMVAVDGHRGGVGETKARHLEGHVQRLEVTLGLTREQVTVVGDITDDADAAAAAGVRCVLYDGGSQPVSALEATGYPVAATLVEAVGLTSTMSR